MAAREDFPGRGNSAEAINEDHGQGANPYVDPCYDLNIYTNGNPPNDPASFVDLIPLG